MTNIFFINTMILYITGEYGGGRSILDYYQVEQVLLY